MATNFSVADAGLQSYVRDGGVNVSRYRRMRSAVLDAVAATGGKVYPGLAPMDNSIPITTGQGPIVGVTESLEGGSVSNQTSARTADHMSLLIKSHGEVERTTDAALMAQLHGVSTPGAFEAQLVADKMPAIMAGFDADHLGALETLSTTDVEWTGDPVADINSIWAIYDETPYYGDAMILTRKGARLFGLSTDSQNRLQFTGSLQQAFPVDVPIFYTDANATDIGLANVLALVGPFSACAVGEAGSTQIKAFDQLEPTAGGAQQNIHSFQVRRYMGFAHPAAAQIPATGWVTLTDDA